MKFFPSSFARPHDLKGSHPKRYIWLNSEFFFSFIFENSSSRIVGCFLDEAPREEFLRNNPNDVSIPAKSSKNQ